MAYDVALAALNGAAGRVVRSQPPSAEQRNVRCATVVKLGGSLVRSGAHEALLELIAELVSAGHDLVTVPGGGVFADAVRRESEHAASSETAVHWMATLAMDQMAYLLAGRSARTLTSDASRTIGRTITPTPCVVRSPWGIIRALAQRRIPILAPFRWLRAADPLPHSWDVTSDSIAAWLAAQLGARRLILLKSVDGVRDGSGRLRPNIARAALDAAERGTGVVDRYFARALAADTECWLINGRRPERLRALVEHHTTIGSLVC